MEEGNEDGTELGTTFMTIENLFLSDFEAAILAI